MVPTYTSLTLAVLALWLGGDDRASVVRRNVWLLPWVASLAAALAFGIVQPVGLVWIVALAAATIWFSRSPAKRWQHVAVGVALLVLAAGLTLHRLPGFNNPRVISAVRFSADATPFTLYLNYDKTLVGLFILGWCHSRIARATEWRAMLVTTAPRAVAVIVLLMVLSVAVGYVRFEPKFPADTWLWLWVNLCFTCLAEEALFRGPAVDKGAEQQLKMHKERNLVSPCGRDHRPTWQFLPIRGIFAVATLFTVSAFGATAVTGAPESFKPGAELELTRDLTVELLENTRPVGSLVLTAGKVVEILGFDSQQALVATAGSMQVRIRSEFVESLRLRSQPSTSPTPQSKSRLPVTASPTNTEEKPKTPLKIVPQTRPPEVVDTRYPRLWQLGGKAQVEAILYRVRGTQVEFLVADEHVPRVYERGSLSDADRTYLQVFDSNGYLSLASGWHNERRIGEEQNIVRDLLNLFRDVSPGIDILGNRNLPILGNVGYLTPRREVEGRLKLRQGASTECIVPGFPKNSFHISTYRWERAFLPPQGDAVQKVQSRSGRISDASSQTPDSTHFELLLLLFDANDSLVAAEFETSKRDGAGLQPPLRNERYLLSAILGYRTRFGNTAVRWDTSTRCVVPNPVGGTDRLFQCVSALDDGKKRIHTTLLLIPEKVIAAVKYNLGHNFVRPK